MKKISPSLMCVSIFELDNALKVFEQESIEYLHIDVMDGEFVPNITLGIDYLEQLREKTTIPLDIHLMIKDPFKKIGWFNFREGELVSIHVESDANICETIKDIKKTGAGVLLAVKPATDFRKYLQYIEFIDGFLIMTVEPGFAGQKLRTETLEKIKDLSDYLTENQLKRIIEVDGNVSYENAKVMSELGANMFVAGTSSFLKKDADLQDGIQLFKEKIGWVS